jgi:hypothetical protein
MAKTTPAPHAAETKPLELPASGGSRTLDQLEARARFLAGDVAQLDKMHPADRPAPKPAPAA